MAPTETWTNGVANVVVVTGIRRATPDNPDGPYAALQFGIAPVDSDTTAMTDRSSRCRCDARTSWAGSRLRPRGSPGWPSCVRASAPACLGSATGLQYPV